MSIVVRTLNPSDIDDAVALQAACFPPPFPPELLWTGDHLSRHIEVFPEGQLVALREGRVVGSATNLIISECNFQGHRNWEDTVGGHYLNSHDPAGSTLFGVDISVHPDFRRHGVGRALYAARFDLVRHLGLTRYATACRMPNFAASGLDSVEQFAHEVVGGTRSDRTLTPLLRMGLTFVGVVHNHMEDEESGNAAALLVWEPEP